MLLSTLLARKPLKLQITRMGLVICNVHISEYIHQLQGIEEILNEKSTNQIFVLTDLLISIFFTFLLIQIFALKLCKTLHVG